MPSRATDTIREAFAAHRTVDAAAQALGVGRRTIFRWLREDPTLAVAGVDRAGPGRVRSAGEAGEPAVKRARARACLAAGASRQAAASAAGVDLRTIRRWVAAGLM